MQELLSLLEDPLAEGLGAAWARCVEAGGRLERRLACPAGLDEDQREELRAGLDRLMRLNAIARKSLRQGQERLASKLALTRQESAQVKAYSRGPAATGGTCDLAG